MNLRLLKIVVRYVLANHIRSVIAVLRPIGRICCCHLPHGNIRILESEIHEGPANAKVDTQGAVADVHAQHLQAVNEVLSRVEVEEVRQHAGGPGPLVVDIGEGRPAEIHREGESQVALHAGATFRKFNLVEIVPFLEIDLAVLGEGGAGKSKRCDG